MAILDHSLIRAKELAPKEAYEPHPFRIMQFGEGNFIRAYFNWMIHQLNTTGEYRGRAVAVQPTPHGKKMSIFDRQDGSFTVMLKGYMKEKVIDESEVITSIGEGINPYEDWERFLTFAASEELQVITSNTTEAGLSYTYERLEKDRACLSFPGKVTQLLYARYQAFKGSKEGGLHILPLELIDNNGSLLKEIILRKIHDWELGGNFKNWVLNHQFFITHSLIELPAIQKRTTNTIFIRLGYEDYLLTVAEPYHLLVIEGNDTIKDILPLHKVSGLNVQYGEVKAYSELKVRLLNAPHTMMFALAQFVGTTTVKQAMSNDQLRQFIKEVMHSVIRPVLPQTDEEKEAYIEGVIERFDNPYQHHQLSDLGLNGMQKFRSRVVPIWRKWKGEETAAEHYLSLSLAALIYYFRPTEPDQESGTTVINGIAVPLREELSTMNFMYAEWNNVSQRKQTMQELVLNVMNNEQIWKESMECVSPAVVASYLTILCKEGGSAAIETLMKHTNK
ncbi:LOW QUALITY PROTEIN: altronate oxidoreductase [Geomicrobium sp. JCM 19039]|nr:LOW QUALITY PROTEIN: altronate oxidoreductase [Geomicrobium sp. JCM 19039]